MARANLRARDYQIDLSSKLNKTQVGAGGATGVQHWVVMWAWEQEGACVGAVHV